MATPIGPGREPREPGYGADRMSRDLLLGPLVRYAGREEATVWVETDGPGEVEVRAEGVEPARASTWTIAGHHYAIVRVRGLAPDTATPYEVHLDGTRVWPQADSPFPPSVLRTHDHDHPAKIVWGSCRVCVPHEPPYSLTKDEDDRGREVDALRTFALRMRHEPVEDWPHLILLLGDQVYADEVSPKTLERIKQRRDVSEPPGEEIADYEEYTMLYQESWGEPVMRWLLSTVPSAMIFDDHDVHDDWNTSLSWVEEARELPWWHKRIEGAFMSYWVYQHIGNLPPDELEDDAFYTAVSEEEDGTEVLAEFARRADREIDGVRWSFCRDVGSARVVMIDSRAGRVLTPGHRSMIDPDEWRWITEHARGGVDHLILGTSLPLLLGPGLHHVESWNEAVCDGAWGPAAAKVGEKIRRAVDLEHWPAFHRSFEAFCGLLADVADRAARRAAGDDHDRLGRRAPRLSRRGRLQARHECQLARLAGGLLAVPQPARQPRAARHPHHLDLHRRPHRPRPGALRRGRRPAGATGGWSIPSPGSTTRSPASSSTAGGRRSRSTRPCRTSRTPASSGSSSARSRRGFSNA